MTPLLVRRPTFDLIRITSLDRREQRDEVLKICDVFRARAIDMSPDRVTIEITAFSRGNSLLTRAAGPIGRIIQARTVGRYLDGLAGI